MFVRNLGNIMRLPMGKSFLHIFLTIKASKNVCKSLQIKQDEALPLKISIIFVFVGGFILKYRILSSKGAFLFLIFIHTETSKW